MTQTHEVYGETHRSVTVKDDKRKITVSDDKDAIHTCVEIDVQIDSQAHLPDAWECDTTTVRFTNRYDADGSAANIDA